MNTFDIGDVVRLQTTFRNLDGTAEDPTSVSVSIKKPNANPTTYVWGTDAELVSDGDGVFHIDVDIVSEAASAGTWRWRWFSNGNGKAAEEGAFKIRRSKFITT